MKKIRIGTRTSKMAMFQTHQVVDALTKQYPSLALDGGVEIVPIVTKGDTVRDRRLSEVGGNGLFIRELENALTRGDIDMAVNSTKDVPSIIDDQFELAAIMERDDPWDAFISPIAQSLEDLPQGATLGTCSPRREALSLAIRPDLKMVIFRGNADTRLEKMKNGEVDATYLAISGLQRLGMEDRATKVLNADEMLPAAGQGAVCIEILKKNEEIKHLVQAINHEPSYRCVMAERQCLAEMHGDCHTPLAAFAQYDSNKLITLKALAARVDGSEIIRHEMTAPAESYKALGEEVGRTIYDQMGDGFFDKAA